MALNCYESEFSENFADLGRGATAAKRMNVLSATAL